MDNNFENQKEKLLAIKQEISLLYQQVNYLLRNEKPLELLDLDVLMNRTHTLYDQLCAINVGVDPDDEDLPFDAESLSGLFGGMMADGEETPPEAEGVEEQETDPEPVEVATVSVCDEAVPNPVVDPEPVVEQPIEETAVVEPETTTRPVEKEVSGEEKPLGDEFGFFFRFEEIPNEEKTSESPVESESKVIHVVEAVPEEAIPERDRVHGDDLVQDNPFEMPKMDEEKPTSTIDEIERQNSGTVSGFFEPDDAGFELSTGETLGEKMMGQDNSLAAKLHQNPVRDLKSVIGINDKFLFVNELFGGSMEKYNKSIENLNDLKTLNGAMIYLNELKIELQWNSSNEAYLKLRELVSRKFE